jgi:hypothetical protein
MRQIAKLCGSGVLAFGLMTGGPMSGGPMSSGLMSVLPVAADEPVLLTVTGQNVTSNRPEFDPFSDAFLAFNDKSFAQGHALTHADLTALEQVEILAAAQTWSAPVTARGPRLSHVLDKAGVSPDASVTLVALDGYAVTLDPVERKLQNWVLAVETDGQPLGIGGRGPAWLMYESGDDPVDADAEGRWVWSVYLITVE